jgi:hypothetical protein
MKKLMLSGFLVFSLIGMAIEEIPAPAAILVDDIELSDNWTEYLTFDGVKIEYKMKQCGGDKMRAQNLLLFKFTNTTEKDLTISWVTKEFRNGECWNCERMYGGDFSHSLTLVAGETIEGDGTSKDNKEVYVF